MHRTPSDATAGVLSGIQALVAKSKVPQEVTGAQVLQKELLWTRKAKDAFQERALLCFQLALL